MLIIYKYNKYNLYFLESSIKIQDLTKSVYMKDIYDTDSDDILNKQ